MIEIREYLIEIRACFTTSPKLDRDGCSLWIMAKTAQIMCMHIK